MSSKMQRHLLMIWYIFGIMITNSTGTVPVYKQDKDLHLLYLYATRRLLWKFSSSHQSDAQYVEYCTSLMGSHSIPPCIFQYKHWICSASGDLQESCISQNGWSRRIPDRSLALWHDRRVHCSQWAWRSSVGRLGCSLIPSGCLCRDHLKQGKNVDVWFTIATSNCVHFGHYFYDGNVLYIKESYYYPNNDLMTAQLFKTFVDTTHPHINAKSPGLPPIHRVDIITFLHW